MSFTLLWDLETYPNCFQFGALRADSDQELYFELSEYRNDASALFAFLRDCIKHQVEFVGFNSNNFDSPIIHHLIANQSAILAADNPGMLGASLAYEKADAIIKSNDRWEHSIWASDRLIPQIDLFTLNHFDNPAKRMSLKALQFTMRRDNIQELPITPGTLVTPEQRDELARYLMRSDLPSTKQFFHACSEEIEFRRSLVPEFGPDVLNWSDVKIGSQFLITKLGDAACYDRSSGRRKPRQTWREEVRTGEIILDCVTFTDPNCKLIHDAFKRGRVEIEEKPRSIQLKPDTALGALSCTLAGVQYHFGLGGIHGAVNNRAFKSDENLTIIDVDVASYYPSIAIEWSLSPEHLRAFRFVEHYAALRDERKGYPKGTTLNLLYKLALNGAFGQGNSKFSVFFDPQFLLSITVNGQLMLLMLIEQLIAVPGVEMIQANTDGITLACSRDRRDDVNAACEAWMQRTRMPLEFAEYSAFFCHDVSNYTAETIDGVRKRKGKKCHFPEKPSDYNGWWHKNYSGLIIQKAAEAALFRESTIEDFIAQHTDKFDFMLCARPTHGAQNFVGDRREQKVLRYFAATDGEPLSQRRPLPSYGQPGAYKKANGVTEEQYNDVMATLPPDTWDERIHTKNKSRWPDHREMIKHASVIACNDVADWDWNRLDRSWYVAEAHKLVDCFS